MGVLGGAGEVHVVRTSNSPVSITMQESRLLVISLTSLSVRVNLLALWEEFRSLRGRFGLFGVATPCRAAHEIGKFLPMKRANLQTGSIIMILPFGGSFTDTSVCFFK